MDPTRPQHIRMTYEAVRSDQLKPAYIKELDEWVAEDRTGNEGRAAIALALKQAYGDRQITLSGSGMTTYPPFFVNLVSVNIENCPGLMGVSPPAGVNVAFSVYQGG